MADLVRVRFKNGKESTVSEAYLARWPEDIAEVLSATRPELGDDLDSSESTPEPTPVQVPKVAHRKEKK